jgi:hypothetical protein
MQGGASETAALWENTQIKRGPSIYGWRNQPH